MNIFDKKLNSALESSAWINIETINAIIIIGLISLLTLGGFVAGFVFPLFVIVMLVSFLIALAYPRSGVYAIVFLTFIFERFFALAPVIIGRQEYKLYPLDIILVAIFAGVFFQILVDSEKIKGIFKEGKYLMIFVVLASVHFFIDIFIGGADKGLAFSSFKYYVFYPIIYFAVFVLFKNKNDITRLIKFALAGALGIIFFILYGIISGGGLWTEFTPLSTQGIRILAFTHAFYLSMAIIVFWVWALINKKESFWINAITIIWIVGIVGSLMRHLWIGLAVSVALIYFLIPKESRIFFQKKIFRYVIAGVLSLAAILFVSLLSPYYTQTSKITEGLMNSIEERVGSFSNISGDESFSWRELVWKKVAKDYAQDPFWGIGFGKKVYVETEEYREFVEVRDIHNSWLTLFVQVGPVAFLFFLMFLFKSVKNVFKKRSEDWMNITLLVLMVNYFVIALFQPYWETNMLGIFFWMILGTMGVYNLNHGGKEKSLSV